MIVSQSLIGAALENLRAQPQLAAQAVINLRAVKIADWQSNLSMALSDEPVTIDGLTISGLKTSYEAMIHGSSNPLQRFATVGDMWDAGGFNPAATVNAAGLEQMAQTPQASCTQHRRRKWAKPKFGNWL